VTLSNSASNNRISFYGAYTLSKKSYWADTLVQLIIQATVTSAAASKIYSSCSCFMQRVCVYVAAKSTHLYISPAVHAFYLR
jgi:hypothetical protein